MQQANCLRLCSAGALQLACCKATPDSQPTTGGKTLGHKQNTGHARRPQRAKTTKINPLCQTPTLVAASQTSSSDTSAATSRLGTKRTRRKSQPAPATITKTSLLPPIAMAKPLLLSLAVALCVLVAPFAAGQASKQYFEVQPEAQQLVPSGQDVRLRCLVRNLQGECHWMRNGRTIGVIAKKYQFSRAPNDGDCSLWIRNVSVVSDDGTWQCQVTATDVDQETLESREMSLVVLLPPERPQIKSSVSFDFGYQDTDGQKVGQTTAAAALTLID